MKTGKFLIYHKENVSVYLKNCNWRDIEIAAKLDAPNNIEFRIPPLTYLQFEIANESTKEVQFNLFQMTLKDATGKIFRIIPEAELRKMFTSVAYSNFKYKQVFSFYITQQNNSPPPKGHSFFSKYPPESVIKLEPGYSGFQIIPFEFISEKNTSYVLNLTFPDQENAVTIPLDYIIYRSDIQPRK